MARKQHCNGQQHGQQTDRQTASHAGLFTHQQAENAGRGVRKAFNQGTPFAGLKSERGDRLAWRGFKATQMPHTGSC
jgi:hypothetical protein